jgi:hypothetical protein
MGGEDPVENYRSFFKENGILTDEFDATLKVK